VETRLRIRMMGGKHLTTHLQRPLNETYAERPRPRACTRVDPLQKTRPGARDESAGPRCHGHRQGAWHRPGEHMPGVGSAPLVITAHFFSDGHGTQRLVLGCQHSNLPPPTWAGRISSHTALIARSNGDGDAAAS